MKARVKATGEIVEVVFNGFYYESMKDESIFDKSELEILSKIKEPDYWDKLLHQYAGMAMQAYIIAAHISQFSFCENENDMKDCVSMATALVEKLKGE